MPFKPQRSTSEGGTVTDWSARWLVTVAGDVSTRDGIGWEFTDFQSRDVWAVFREDGGDFPVFSAARRVGHAKGTRVSGDAPLLGKAQYVVVRCPVVMRNDIPVEASRFRSR